MKVGTGPAQQAPSPASAWPPCCLRHRAGHGSLVGRKAAGTGLDHLPVCLGHHLSLLCFLLQPHLCGLRCHQRDLQGMSRAPQPPKHSPAGHSQREVLSKRSWTSISTVFSNRPPWGFSNFLKYSLSQVHKKAPSAPFLSGPPTSQGNRSEASYVSLHVLRPESPALSFLRTRYSSSRAASTSPP